MSAPPAGSAGAPPPSRVRPSGRPGPVLALDASSARPGVALLDGAGGLLQAWAQDPGVPGTAQLAPRARELLDRHGLAARDLLGVAVGVGPGSYTGLRASIALARAIAFAAGRPLAGVASTAAAARAALAADPALERVVVLLDARRGELYRADHARGGGPGEVLTTAAPHLVAADAPRPVPAPGLLVMCEPVPEAYHVGALGRAALLVGGDDPAAVVPLYLKRSHAEIALLEREGAPREEQDEDRA